MSVVILPAKIKSRRPPLTKTDYVPAQPLYSAADWTRILDEGNAEGTYRNGARRDCARILHSPSFRRQQGKTQLFPGHESDYFRNRLTHSLEVAQISESIAHKINFENPYFQKNPICTRTCFTAGLIHDLGHPPFGHNGEHALDDKMKQYGGFEGNAQTFRILSRLEKKRRAKDDFADERIGLNLCLRTLAASLKYDREIDHTRGPDATLIKGYYADDRDRVEKVKSAVYPNWSSRKGHFKTIECSIMDLADDIAYSTYDLEDSLKAGFLSPADILASSPELLSRVAEKVSKASGKPFADIDVMEVWLEIFSGIGGESDNAENAEDQSAIGLFNAVRLFQSSRDLACDGYLRTEFTAQLVGDFIDGVEVTVDAECPAMSKVKLNEETLKKVETLKNYTFEATIFSPRLKVAEYRGYEVVSGIFDALASDKGHLLLPADVRALYSQFKANATARMRVICDFVAGMTDRYALEFYARLHSDSPQSIFKPI